MSQVASIATSSGCRSSRFARTGGGRQERNAMMKVASGWPRFGWVPAMTGRCCWRRRRRPAAAALSLALLLLLLVVLAGECRAGLARSARRPLIRTDNATERISNQLQAASNKPEESLATNASTSSTQIDFAVLARDFQQDTLKTNTLIKVLNDTHGVNETMRGRLYGLISEDISLRPHNSEGSSNESTGASIAHATNNNNNNNNNNHDHSSSRRRQIVYEDTIFTNRALREIQAKMNKSYEGESKSDPSIHWMILYNGTTILAVRSANKYYYWKIGQSVGSAIIFCMIVVGNLSILHRLKSHRRRRSNVNYFIVQLAIADLLVGLFCVTSDTWLRIQKVFMWSLFACRASKYFSNLFIFASTNLLVALSIDRWEAVVKPLAFTRNSSRGYHLVGASWLLAIVSALPVTFFMRIKDIDGISQCWIDLDGNGWRLYMIYLTSLLLVLPTLIIAVCYIHIVYTIWSKGRLVVGKQQQHQQQHQLQLQLQLQQQQQQQQRGGHHSHLRGNSSGAASNSARSRLRQEFSSSSSRQLNARLSQSITEGGASREATTPKKESSAWQFLLAIAWNPLRGKQREPAANNAEPVAQQSPPANDRVGRRASSETAPADLTRRLKLFRRSKTIETGPEAATSVAVQRRPDEAATSASSSIYRRLNEETIKNKAAAKSELSANTHNQQARLRGERRGRQSKASSLAQTYSGDSARAASQRTGRALSFARSNSCSSNSSSSSTTTNAATTSSGSSSSNASTKSNLATSSASNTPKTAAASKILASATTAGHPELERHALNVAAAVAAAAPRPQTIVDGPPITAAPDVGSNSKGKDFPPDQANTIRTPDDDDGDASAIIAGSVTEAPMASSREVRPDRLAAERSGGSGDDLAGATLPSEYAAVQADQGGPLSSTSRSNVAAAANMITMPKSRDAANVSRNETNRRHLSSCSVVAVPNGDDMQTDSQTISESCDRISKRGSVIAARRKRNSGGPDNQSDQIHHHQGQSTHQAVAATTALSPAAATAEARAQRQYQTQQPASCGRDQDFVAQQHGSGVIPKARIKTIKMTLVIVVAYILCWSPFLILNLCVVFGRFRNDTNVSHALMTLSQSLAHLNSAVNPIIFWLFSSKRNQSNTNQAKSAAQIAAAAFAATAGVGAPTTNQPNITNNQKNHAHHHHHKQPNKIATNGAL